MDVGHPMKSDLPFIEAEERQATVTMARGDRRGPGAIARAIALYWRRHATACTAGAACKSARSLPSGSKAAGIARMNAMAPACASAQIRAGGTQLRPPARALPCGLCAQQRTTFACRDADAGPVRLACHAARETRLRSAALHAIRDRDEGRGSQLVWRKWKRGQDKSTGTPWAQDRMQPCLKTARHGISTAPSPCRAQQRPESRP